MWFMLTLLLAVPLFFAWRAISELRERVRELEAQARLNQPAILGDLIARLTRLEAAVRQATGQQSARSAASAEPAIGADSVVVSPPAPARTPLSGAAGPVTPAAPPPAEPPAIPAPSLATTPLAATGTPAPAAAAAPPPAAPGPVTAPTPPSDGDAWEVVVGTSWLNKIGVLVFVVGVALLVGYSFANIGPLGRVAMGFALSLALLAAGVVLERRDAYRNYAYGLIAGGWAGIYFTAFAMHAVPEARVIDSAATAAAALLAISAGMIGHSLRYRSQTVTALAYVAAYAALALVPLSSFALLASVPLALSLLVVAARLRWSGVAVLGVASTYALFVLRLDVLADGSIPVGSALPLLTLGVYWLMFEIADIAAAGPGGRGGSLSLFPLNAVGLIGAASLQLPVNDPATMTTFTALASAAYLVSAVVRARLAPAPAGAADGERAPAGFGTTHAAVALAAALAAWSIDLRFSGNAQTLALLLLAELIVVAGFAIVDRPIRIIGGVVLAVAALHGGARAFATLLMDDPSAGLFASTTPIAVLVALACYLNREVLRARRLPAAVIERTYTSIAFLLIGVVLAHEVPNGDWPMAAAAFGIVLLEAGLRRSAGYRYQAYLAGLFAGLMLLIRYLVETGRHIFDATTRPAPSDGWLVIAATALLLAAAWLRLRQRAEPAGAPADLAAAAPIAGGVTTLALVLLVWHLLPAAAVAPAWAAMALASTAAGARAASAGARWQGYILATAAVLRASTAIVELAPASPAALLSASVAMAAAYATSLVPRRAIAAAQPGTSDGEPAGRIVTSIAATLLLTVLILNEAPLRFVTVGWGLEGLALFVAGFAARDRVLRLSGLGVLLACLLKLFLSDLHDLEPLARIMSAVVLGLVLLAVSWTYTRYQEQIRRLL
jgi:uncharacterized membrane protein